MRLLLDTHALLWWWGDDPQLPQRTRIALGDESNEVLVSAATAWEIATKQRIGKLPPLPMPAGGFDGLVTAEGFGLLAISPLHAWQAGTLAWTHRDPFDRVLAAQTVHEGLTLVTRDPVFSELALPTFW